MFIYYNKYISILLKLVRDSFLQLRGHFKKITLSSNFSGMAIYSHNPLTHSPESPVWLFFSPSPFYLQLFLKSKTVFKFFTSQLPFTRTLRLEFFKLDYCRLKLRKCRRYKEPNLRSNLVLTHVIYSFKGCFLSSKQGCLGEQIREIGKKLKIQKN